MHGLCMGISVCIQYSHACNISQEHIRTCSQATRTVGRGFCISKAMQLAKTFNYMLNLLKIVTGMNDE